MYHTLSDKFGRGEERRLILGGINRPDTRHDTHTQAPSLFISLCRGRNLVLEASLMKSEPGVPHIPLYQQMEGERAILSANDSHLSLTLCPRVHQSMLKGPNRRSEVFSILGRQVA